MHYLYGFFFYAPYTDRNKFERCSCCLYTPLLNFIRSVVFSFFILWYPTDWQNMCTVITTVLEHWSVLAYYRSSQSAYPVKQWLQKNKLEQVDWVYAIMPEVADYNHEWISQWDAGRGCYREPCVCVCLSLSLSLTHTHIHTHTDTDTHTYTHTCPTLSCTPLSLKTNRQ